MKRGSAADSGYHSRPDASLSQLAKAQDRQKPSMGHADGNTRARPVGLGQTVRAPEEPTTEHQEENVSVATGGRLCTVKGVRAGDGAHGPVVATSGNIHPRPEAKATGLNLTNQDLDILRSSMLSLPSTFWSNSDSSRNFGSLAEPSAAGQDSIPEEIKYMSVSPRTDVGPAVVMSASTAKRHSRPLSNRLTAATQVSRHPVTSVSQGVSTDVDNSLGIRKPAAVMRSPRDQGRKVLQRSASGRNTSAAVQSTVAAACDGNSSTPSTPRQTDGDTILHGLAQQAQQLQHAGSAQQGADLQSAVATLTKLRAQEGFNLDLLFETLLESRSIQEPASATGTEAGAAMQQRPINMRLPRGLLSGTAKQNLVGASDNQIVIRLLNAHEKSSDSVALNRIQLHDENEQQVPLPATHVCVRNCPPTQHTEISVLVSGSSSQPWIARLPKVKGSNGESTGHVEIVITLPEPPSSAFGAPCTLRVWNCSGPSAPVHKGVKWLAVFRGAKVIWHGVLRQGSSASSASSTSTCIPLTTSQPVPAPSISPPLQTATSLAQATSLTGKSASSVPTPELVAPAPVSDLAALSDAALLAELQRRGIATGPVGAAATLLTTSAAPEHETAPIASRDPTLTSQGSGARSSAAEQQSCEDLMKTVSTYATVPAQSSCTSRTTNSSHDSHPMPSESPRFAYKVGRDSDAAGRELVLSADANTILPAIHMPEITVDEKQSSLSPRFNLSPEVRSRANSLGSSPNDDEDISLSNAVKQRVDSVTHALVSERHGRNVNCEQAVPGSAAGVERGPDSRCEARADGGVLSELPQGSSSSVGTEVTAPLSLQPDKKPRSQPDAFMPLPQAPQSSLAHALEGSDPLLDKDVLGDYVGKSQPSGRVSARRKQGLHTTGALVPAGAPRHDAENVLGCARQPTGGRSGPPVDLNQSLDSLTFFQRHNRSRLVERYLPQVHEDGTEAAEGDTKVESHKGELSAQLPASTTSSCTDAASKEPQQTVMQPSSQRPRLTGAKESRPDVLKQLPSAPGAALKASVAEWSEWSVKHEGLSFLMDMSDSSKQPPAVGEQLSSCKLASALATPKEWPDPDFRLPLEPSGRHLELRLFTTWGDLHYIGLSAVEVFDASGTLVSLKDRASKVTAEPHSVNSLPEYSNDPRVPSNLFDGVNCTSSDLHQWLAPYTPGGQHIVRVDLGETITLGMLRFWNYNKSRIHAQRGVRSMEAWLDGKCIFQGEVSQAPGAVQDAPQCAESVLYTTSKSAITAIEAHDALYEQPAESNEVDMAPHVLPSCAPAIEVVTAAGSGDIGALMPLVERPHTAAVVPAAPPSALCGIQCSVLLMEVLDTWGDMDFVGLTSVQVLDGKGEGIALSMDDVVTDPRDLNTIMHHSGDDRTPDKLVDGVSVTMDDRHMWLAPCADHNTIVCTITLQVSSTPTLVSGIRFWNYNKDAAGTHRGVGVVRVYADGKLITPETGVAIAKAPGTDSVDFGHTLPLPHKKLDLRLSGTPQEAGLIAAMQDPTRLLKALKQAGSMPHHNTMVRQGCVTPVLPCGFVVKLVIWNSWADPFYVGLAGMEVHDAVSGPVTIPASRVNGEVSGAAAQSWLAPRPKNTSSHDMKPNVVVLVLPTAIALSKVKFWNYHKNPERGVCELEMFLDDNLIFSGYLKQASAQISHQTILFTNDPAVIAAEKSHVVDCAQEVPQSHVTLIDESRVRHRGDTLVDKRLDPTDRPNTAVVF